VLLLFAFIRCDKRQFNSITSRN